MKLVPTIRDQLLANVPSLSKFAISLYGNINHADDPVKLLRMLIHINSFKPGINMQAWLIIILPKQFREEYCKQLRDVEDADENYAQMPVSHREQTDRVEFEDLRAALAKHPAEQREALIPVGALDFSYDVDTPLRGCAVGTIKSRVHRGRARLADLFANADVSNFGFARAARRSCLKRTAALNCQGTATEVSDSQPSFTNAPPSRCLVWCSASTATT